MIRFCIDKLHLDGSVTNHWEALLRVVGDFSIELHGKAWYSEQDFCVLEFLRAFMKWRGQLDAEPTEELEYQSLESAEPWLIRASQLQDGRWRFEALHAAPSGEDGTQLADVDIAAAALVRKVANSMPDAKRIIDILRDNPDNAHLAMALERARK